MTLRIHHLAPLCLLAHGVVLPQAHADEPAPRSPERVAFADATPSPEVSAPPTPRDPAPPPARATSRRAPRFQLAVGPYTTTRTLAFAVAETTAVDELPETPPESTLVGGRLDLALFPAGGTDARGRLIGPGLTASYRHSIGGSARYDDLDTDESLDLPVVDAAWSLGVRYRQPLGPALVEVGLAHESASRRVDERPAWLELPDADYRAVAGSLRLELTLRPGAVLAVGGSLQHVLDAGELMADDGYGAGSIRAYTAEAAVDVRLAGAVFATGGLALHQVTIEFAGEGELSVPADEDIADVYGAVDRAVTASLAVGVRY